MFFFVCLEPAVRKDTWIRTTSFIVVCVCVIFFGKWHCESYLIRAMFKLPSQQLQVTSATAFWEIPYTWIFYGHGSTYVLNLSSTPCKCHNIRIDEGSWTIISCTKSELARQRTMQQNNTRFIILYTSVSLKPSFKFNLVLVDILNKFRHNLFTFWLSLFDI